MGRTVGVDLGATLAKIVTDDDLDSGELLPSTDTARVRTAVLAREPARAVVTGGGTSTLGDLLDGIPVTMVSECDAWARGVRRVAEANDVTLPPEFLLVSVGTGTSVLRVGHGPAVRVGGTAVGGGTLMGLGRLLTACEGFDEIVALASAGDRREVDLLVGEVYAGGTAPPEIRDLTASNFAKLTSRNPADLAHAVVGLVGETVALVAGGLAGTTGLQTVVYCGTTFARNAPLVGIVEGITRHFGHESHVLVRGGFCGAIGAAAMAPPAA